ncbi:hypothetical protein EDEG_01764 [Edhazardia aedis USNM 41457]|uniref:Uncharacterized protein n=1 Tax=Edhazardia aedis (strain USNM 41457) TaxID=1003232 RepID=J8ZW71_EDHAE|nr:hypothetical protein EDEG_01764 [Edhazardia aedis USNM 41457]|eukprot:EJW03938.1 hypothetical protein EDEG_01764 [Edhazardia aedis USNM 41457]
MMKDKINFHNFLPANNVKYILFCFIVLIMCGSNTKKILDMKEKQDLDSHNRKSLDAFIDELLGNFSEKNEYNDNNIKQKKPFQRKNPFINCEQNDFSDDDKTYSANLGDKDKHEENAQISTDTKSTDYAGFKTKESESKRQKFEIYATCCCSDFKCNSHQRRMVADMNGLINTGLRCDKNDYLRLLSYLAKLQMQGLQELKYHSTFENSSNPSTHTGDSNIGRDTSVEPKPETIDEKKFCMFSDNKVLKTDNGDFSLRLFGHVDDLDDLCSNEHQNYYTNYPLPLNYPKKNQEQPSNYQAETDKELQSKAGTSDIHNYDFNECDETVPLIKEQQTFDITGFFKESLKQLNTHAISLINHAKTFFDYENKEKSKKYTFNTFKESSTGLSNSIAPFGTQYYYEKLLTEHTSDSNPKNQTYLQSSDEDEQIFEIPKRPQRQRSINKNKSGYKN